MLQRERKATETLGTQNPSILVSHTFETPNFSMAVSVRTADGMYYKATGCAGTTPAFGSLMEDAQ